MQVDFYHLTGAPLERVLPRIVERVLAGGERLLVVADGDRLAALDRALWTYAADSFLPHARAGGDSDADQPVLLSDQAVAANGAAHIALVDGVWQDEALQFTRAFHFFDDDRVVEARLAWKALATQEDVTRRYWKQSETGRWEQAA